MALVHDLRGNRRKHAKIQIEFWDLQTGRKMGSVEQTGTIQLSMQFSQDGRQLRTWYRKKMSLWSVADQALIGERHVETSPNLMFATSNRHWSIGIHNRNQIELRDVHTGFWHGRWGALLLTEATLMALFRLCATAKFFNWRALQNLTICTIQRSTCLRSVLVY